MLQVNLMDVIQYMQTLGQNARQASRAMARASTRDKNQALLAIAAGIRANRAAIMAANQQDMQNGRDNGMDAALLDRLEVTESRIDAMLARPDESAPMA